MRNLALITFAIQSNLLGSIQRRSKGHWMASFGRRRSLIVASVAGLLLAGSIAFVLVRGDDLRTRLAMVSEGMTRAQVVAILGRPEVTLQRARPEDGQVLLWVDQLWQ